MEKWPTLNFLLNNAILYTCGFAIQDAVYYDETFNSVYENVYVKGNLTMIEFPFYNACDDTICTHCVVPTMTLAWQQLLTSNQYTMYAKSKSRIVHTQIIN